MWGVTWRRLVRDLLEQTITEVQNERISDVEQAAQEVAESRILDILLDAEMPSVPVAGAPDGGEASPPPKEEGEGTPEAASPAAPGRGGRGRQRARLRRRLAIRLRAKQLEDRYIEVEVEEPYEPPFEGLTGTGLEEVGFSISDFFSQMAPPRKRSKRMTVADARAALTEEETDRLIDMDRVYDDAIADVEEAGIVFMDEVDKICGPAPDRGPDVSGEEVQRDLLPLLEGSVVHTRYGSVRTEHILFIAAGAFNVARPSDLIPEFQGRFPIRVELSPLGEDDLARILPSPTMPSPGSTRLSSAPRTSSSTSLRTVSPSLPTRRTASMSRTRTSARGGCSPSWRRSSRTCRSALRTSPGRRLSSTAPWCSTACATSSATTSCAATSSDAGEPEAWRVVLAQRLFPKTEPVRFRYTRAGMR